MNQNADSALNAIRPVPTDYTTWTNLTMAYKAAGGNYETWLAWCSTGENFNPRENLRRKWDGIDTTGGITAGTLYAEAKAHGWTPTDPTVRYRREYTRPKNAAAAEEKPEVKPQTVEQAHNIAAYIASAKEHASEAAAYCKERGIDADTAKRFCIGYDTASGEIIIPYPAAAYYVARNPKITPNGKVDGGKAKYRYPTEEQAGEKPLFNIPALKNNAGFVCITEGQIDAITLEQAGQPAVAIGNTPTPLIKALNTYGTTARGFIIVPDNDDAGRKQAEKAVKELQAVDCQVYTYALPLEYHDPNDYHTKNPADFYDWARGAAAFAEEREAEQRDEYQQIGGAARIDAYITDWEAGRDTAISTGFSSLDSILDGGLFPGLYAIGAISSLGKTTFALQIADTIAANGRDVMFFALEQSAAELTAKTLSRLTATISLEEERDYKNGLSNRTISCKTLRDAWMQTSQRRTMDAAIQRYRDTVGKCIFIIEGVGDIGAEEIRRAVKNHIRLRGKAPVVFIDYTQIMIASDQRLTDKQNMDKNIVELKRISRDYNIPIVAISSFNRESYTAKVDLSAFKESGAIEYTADCVIGIQPQGIKDGNKDKVGADNKKTIDECKESNLRKLEIVVLKNRNGGIGTVLMDYRTLFNLYTDCGKKKKPKSEAPTQSF